eukprot:ANDGO_04245.mRNA.1 putative protein S-acyltransferase 4
MANQSGADRCSSGGTSLAHPDSVAVSVIPADIVDPNDVPFERPYPVESETDEGAMVSYGSTNEQTDGEHVAGEIIGGPGQTGGSSSRSNSESALAMSMAITGERPQHPLVVKHYYKVWPGKHIMCCGGRLFSGPDLPILFYSLFLILLPSLMWAFLVLPIVAEEGGIVVWVIAGLLVGLSIIFLLLTALSDPGIIPRQPKPKLRPGEQIPRFKTVAIGGENVKMKWCATCNVYRPPRASHCSRCDACILRFDHHCPISTVGVGNVCTYSGTANL